MSATRNYNTETQKPSGRDRRRFTRYQVHQNSILCNGESLAEVLDISAGGLACKSFIDQQDSSKVITDVEILNCDIGQSVQGLNCRRVRIGEKVEQVSVKNGMSPDCFFEFIEMSSRQADELRRFIKESSNGSAPELLFSGNRIFAD